MMFDSRLRTYSNAEKRKFINRWRINSCNNFYIERYHVPYPILYSQWCFTTNDSRFLIPEKRKFVNWWRTRAIISALMLSDSTFLIRMFEHILLIVRAIWMREKRKFNRWRINSCNNFYIEWYYVSYIFTMMFHNERLSIVSLFQRREEKICQRWTIKTRAIISAIMLSDGFLPEPIMFEHIRLIVRVIWREEWWC